MRNYLLKFIFIVVLFFVGNQVLAQLPLSGIKTVGGNSPDYSTINDAVADLSAKGVGAMGVTFKIRNGVYNERVVFPAIIGASETNKIVFESESGKPEDVVITSNGGGKDDDHHTFKFFRTKYFTLKALTVVNSNLLIGSAIHISGGYQVEELSPVSNLAIQNCIIKVNDTVDSKNLVPVCISSNFIDISSTHSIESLSIQECRINGGYNGIFGVRGGFLLNCSILNNKIYNTYHAGIFLDAIRPNLKVSKNEIITRINTDQNSRSVYGLLILGNSNGENLFSNNMIIVNSPGVYATTIGFHLYEGERSNIVHNSILINGTAKMSYSLFVEGKTGSVQTLLRNCILMNNSGGLALSCNYSGQNQYKFDSDYNNYYSSGPLIVNSAKNIEEVKLLSGSDNNSINTFPFFLSDTDLHTFNPAFFEKGIKIQDVVDDIDGDVRNNNSPCIGADEFQTQNVDLAMISVFVPQPSLIDSNSVVIKMRNLGKTSLKDSTFWASFTVDGGSNWSNAEKFKLTKLSNYMEDEEFTFINKFKVPKGKFYTIEAKIVAPRLSKDNIEGNEKVSFELCFPMNGDYTVGPDETDDFTTLTKVEDLINCAGILGPVNIIVKPGEYKGKLVFSKLDTTYAFSIQGLNGNSKEVIITRPSAQPTTSSDRSGILIQNWPNFTLKNLTLRSPFTTYSNTIEVIASDSLLLENVNIESATNPNGLSIGFKCSNSKNLNVQNCSFTGAINGISLEKCDSAVLRHNKIESINGLSLTLSNYPVVEFNTIKGDYQSVGGLITQAVRILSCNDFKLHNNNIMIENLSFGILIDKCKNSSKNISIANNMVSGTIADVAFGVAGIYLGSNSIETTTDSIQLAFNTIRVDSKGDYSYPILVGKSTRAASLINNIFYNAQNNENAYSIVVMEGAEIEDSDHNDFYAVGGKLALWNNSELPTLSSLKTFTGMNKQSVSVDPSFISLSDNHISNVAIADRAKYLESVPFDFDGQPRCRRYPDIGADEFSDCFDGAIDSILSPSNSVLNLNKEYEITVGIKNSGISPMNNFNIGYSINGSEISMETVSGPINFDDLKVYEYTFNTKWIPVEKGTYKICTYLNNLNDINVLNDTVCKFFEVDSLFTGFYNLHSKIKEFEIYPNPANNYLAFKLSRMDVEEHFEICIYSILGEKMKCTLNNRNAGSVLTISLEDLLPGQYFVCLKSDKYISEIKKLQIVR